MARKDVLEGLNLFLENAVDQLTRAQREARGQDAGLDDLDARLDRLFADTTALRNDVRDALMKELARGPKKLPTIR